MKLDIVIHGTHCTVIIEVDQDEHAPYSIVDEVDRHEKAKEIFKGPVEMIRFRPRTQHREKALLEAVRRALSGPASDLYAFGLHVTYIGYTRPRIVALHAEAAVVEWGYRLNGAPFPHKIIAPVKGKRKLER